MILDTIKTIAITFAIAVAAVAVVVFGTFIGGILLFLGAVALMSFILWFFWYSYLEYIKESKKPKKVKWKQKLKKDRASVRE